jgi:hypothetical protein
MKQAWRWLGGLGMVAALAVLVTACGGDGDDGDAGSGSQDPLVGSWELTGATLEGQPLDLAEIGWRLTLTLDAARTFELGQGGDWAIITTNNGAWRASDTMLTLETATATNDYPYALAGDTLTLNDVDAYTLSLTRR